MNRTEITAGGDQLEFPGDTSTGAVRLETAKMVFNSVVGTPDAEFMTIDISNMYLNTPLTDYQYMRFNIKMVKILSHIVCNIRVFKKNVDCNYVVN